MPVSLFAELPRPLAVVANDAGAANIIFHGLENSAGPLRVWATGPAAAIAASCGTPCNVGSLQEALDGAGTLLSGTGWASNVEHDARTLARDRSIPSIAVLDHWVNYPERFRRDGTEVLPDRWWVTDAFAQTEAARHFPLERIDLVPNRYVAAQLARIAPVQATDGNVLLYILEPARSSWGASIEGEFQALDYFVARMGRLGLPTDLTIRLRPHPSDPPGKYDSWMARQSGMTVELDTAPDMAAALTAVKWVAGCESFGLALALYAGRTVFCTLTPNAPLCRLPHDKLIHLRAME